MLSMKPYCVLPSVGILVCVSAYSFYKYYYRVNKRNNARTEESTDDMSVSGDVTGWHKNEVIDTANPNELLMNASIIESPSTNSMTDLDYTEMDVHIGNNTIRGRVSGLIGHIIGGQRD